MSEFDSDAVDWKKVARNLRDANRSLQEAEDEISEGFDGDGDLAALAYENDVPHDIDELIQGVTNSSSYLRNGTMNYIPDE